MSEITEQRLWAKIDKKDQTIEQLKEKLKSVETQSARSSQHNKELLFAVQTALAIAKNSELIDKEKIAAVTAILNRVDF